MAIFKGPVLKHLKDAREHIRKEWGGNRELDCRMAYALGMDWPWRGDEDGSNWRGWVEKKGYVGAWAFDHVLGTDRVPCFTTSLDDIFWAMHKFARADEIKLACDPSGVGARCGRWRLSDDDGPQFWPLGEVVHATPELAFCEALLACLIHEIETGPEMVKLGYVVRAKS